MKLIERVRNILLQPKLEWPVIAAEPSSTAALYTGYIMPLAAIGALASFIGMSLIGYSLPFIGTVKQSMLGGLGMALTQYLLGLLGVFLVAVIINVLAPSFGASKNALQALKVAAYSYTPAWIGAALGIIPALGMLGALFGLYGIYLLYLGLQSVMGAPQDKAAGYTAVVVIAAIVVSIIVGAVVGTLGSLGMGMGPLGAASRTEAVVENEALKKMEKWSQDVAAAGQKLEAAQASGDVNAQAQAATAALGSVLGAGGGEPVDQNSLKALLPEALGALPRKSLEAEKTAMGQFSIARAEASYAEGAQRIKLSIVDTGGGALLMGMAAWANIESEKETEQRIERIYKAGANTIFEKADKDGSRAEYSVLVARRFIVEFDGNGLSLDALKAAAKQVDLAKLASLTAGKG